MKFEEDPKIVKHIENPNETLAKFKMDTALFEPTAHDQTLNSLAEY